LTYGTVWMKTSCDSLNGFKNRLDKFLHGRGFI